MARPWRSIFLGSPAPTQLLGNSAAGRRCGRTFHGQRKETLVKQKKKGTWFKMILYISIYTYHLYHSISISIWKLGLSANQEPPNDHQTVRETMIYHQNWGGIPIFRQTHTDSCVNSCVNEFILEPVNSRFLFHMVLFWTCWVPTTAWCQSGFILLYFIFFKKNLKTAKTLGMVFFFQCSAPGLLGISSHKLLRASPGRSNRFHHSLGSEF